MSAGLMPLQFARSAPHCALVFREWFLLVRHLRLAWREFGKVANGVPDRDVGTPAMSRNWAQKGATTFLTDKKYSPSQLWHSKISRGENHA
jgi:hypothetical protein